ncbi:MAG: aldo/keto reductase, partial [Bacteroidales bacterium]|nr:aldo/keto reductase [Bacteroidales bacterium]
MEKINRRSFIKNVTAGAAAVTAVAAVGCKPGENHSASGEKELGEMSHRVHNTSGDVVSLLGYGGMRWPTVGSGRNAPLDQEEINRLIDYAYKHGVNYYDTSPRYCQGHSEEAMGIALSRYPRDTYFIATKLSNMSPGDMSFEASKRMYENSFKYLQVDYIDYYLLHNIQGISQFQQRFIDNGMLEFLKKEKEAGRIRHLGFSFHGNTECFDYLIDNYKWDFVQIQMNYMDYRHGQRASGNVDGEYVYNRLVEKNTQAIIMEPLLGGRLSSMVPPLTERLKAQRPDKSVASWAFRFIGSFPNILTCLSGMTYMEHLVENVETFSPVETLSEEEFALLEDIAKAILDYPIISCNYCNYCMPCPYGLDIPGIFQNYNKCINEG